MQFALCKEDFYEYYQKIRQKGNELTAFFLNGNEYVAYVGNNGKCG